MSQLPFCPFAGVSVSDFVVVVSNEDEYLCSFHEFAEKVNRKLRAGYRLHGQPFNVSKMLCQAMVRSEAYPAASEAKPTAPLTTEKH